MRFGKKKERFLRALSISQTTIIGWYSALSVLPVITSMIHLPRIKTLGQKWGTSLRILIRARAKPPNRQNCIGGDPAQILGAI